MTPAEQFLAMRLADPSSDWVGMSSNAMVAQAVTGRAIDPWEFPADLGDLSRCCVTFARAPWDLREKMLPTLTEFCEHLKEVAP